MLREEYEKFMSLMDDMGEVFGGKAVTERRREIYLAALRDYPFWIINRVVDRAIAEEEYFPKVARLREMIVTDSEYRQQMTNRKREYGYGPDDWPPPGHPLERISLKQYEEEAGEKLEFSKAVKRMRLVKPEEV